MVHGTDVIRWYMEMMCADGTWKWCVQIVHGNDVYRWYMEMMCADGKRKRKVSMVRILPVDNLLPQNVGSITNYLQKFTEVAQWRIPSCSRLPAATDNGVRDGISNWLAAPPTLMGSTPWAPRAFYKSVQSQINRESILQLHHARQPPCLSGHLGNNHIA